MEHLIFDIPVECIPGSGVCIVQSVMSDSLQLHGLQHARFPCPSPSPGACSNPGPLSW